MFGANLAALAGQLSFGALAGGLIDPARQLPAKAADHRDVLGADRAVALGGGGPGQYRGDRFPGQRAPRPQIGGGVAAPAGLGAAGQRPVGDGMRQFAA
ncbi:hypothetical protein MKAN_04035 [Mycobacterium kansasii ATCC 12478]|uniref:PPE family C-terminal domain-containing protein n=1 Tax=Mycobacterium kansasii ATCC 12478 TaxID=557599 RepID=U5WXX9_MYCKA|nr:hypothetical protein MKAN_04035 [Mycobacterium kansasii ATCC 12478]